MPRRTSSRTRSVNPTPRTRLQPLALEERCQPSVGLTAPDRPAEYAPGHVLVRVADPATVAALGRSAESFAPGYYRVAVGPGETVPTATQALRGRPGVLAAEPDYVVWATDIPTDPHFGLLWGLHNTGQAVGTPTAGNGTVGADIDATRAWDTFPGKGTTVVAVIDSGVDYNHPDLAANIWVNTGELPGNGIDDDGNGFVDDVRGWDFANNDNDPMDDNRHGTHVAGTIAAAAGNGVGVAGVNRHAKIMPVKFLGANGSGLTSNAVAALNYAVANGATVSNNSWGGGGYLQAMFDALTNAAARGHLFVAAAGNANRNTDLVVNYPSGYAVDNIVSVAATDFNDARSGFSNYGGGSVDIAAPGTNIYSTLPNGGYGYLSGTSMAAPHVAGAASLLRDLNPGWSYRQVISRLLTSVDPVLALADVSASGGRLNLHTALIGGPADGVAPTLIGAAFLGAPTTFSSVRLTFSERVNPSTLTPATVRLTRPTGAFISPTAVVGVAGTSGTEFDLTFWAEYAPGTYEVAVGTGVSDLAGNSLANPQTVIQTLAAPTGTVFTATGLPLTIGTQAGAQVVSSVRVSGGLRVSDLNVRLTIEHTWVGDLEIILQGPNNKQVTLFSRHGGSADHLNGTVFDDRAGVDIAAGAAPYSAAYRPFAALSAFKDVKANGTWSLIVRDSAAGNGGRLLAWSLVINSGGSSGFAAGTADGGSIAPWSDTTGPGRAEEAADSGPAVSLIVPHGVELVGRPPVARPDDRPAGAGAARTVASGRIAPADADPLLTFEV